MPIECLREKNFRVDVSFTICLSVYGDIIGEVEEGYVFRFGKLEAVDMRVDDDGIDTGSFETVLSLGRVGGGNHEEGALLSCFGFVSVALEESAGKWIRIIPHEEQFHPGVGGDVVVVLEYPFIGASVFGKPGRNGIGLYGAARIACGGDGTGIVEEAADHHGDEEDAE